MQLLHLGLCLGLAIRVTFTRPTLDVAPLATSAHKDIQARGDTYGSYPFWNPGDTHPTSVALDTPTPTQTPCVESTVSQSVSPTAAVSNTVSTAWETTLAESVVPRSTISASITQNTESQGTPTIRETTVTQTVVKESTVTASVSCDRVRKLQNPTPKDWEEHDMEKKLKAWLEEHMGSDKKFDATWGDWAFGDPDWSCTDDGSESCTNYDCDNAVLNAKNDDDLRLAIYVTQTMINLHSLFTGAGEALTQASIVAALSKDKWVQDFHKEDGDGLKGLKETLATAGILIGIVLAFAAAQPELGVITAGTIGSAGLLANTVPGLLLPHIKKEQENEDYKNGGIIGEILGKIALEAQHQLTIANNDIMDGNGTNTNNMDATASDYFRKGKLLNYQGVDKVQLGDQLTALFQSKAINARWKQQRVFIIGGGPCQGDDGIGTGPEENSLCFNNQRWHLCHYEANRKAADDKEGIALRAPPGIEKLGKDDFAHINKDDVIRSSVSAFKLARYDYSDSLALDRVKNSFEIREGKPFEPSWEGVFTIPVCDVGQMIYHDWPKHIKSKILVPYGKQPHWCGPICDDDNVLTQQFYEVSHIKGLKGDLFEDCDVDLSGKLVIDNTTAAEI